MYSINPQKRLVVFIILSFCLVLSCKKDDNPPPTPSNVHLKNGLLVYLPFEGNFADSSGNGNTVTPLGGATLSYDEHGNSAAAFNGNGYGSALVITNNGSIKFDTAFSMSFDFMIRSTGRWVFASMINYATGKGPSFQAGTSIPSYANFGFAVIDSLATCDGWGNENNASTQDTTAFIPQVESWYNATVIFHKGIMQTYINGKLRSTKTAPMPTVQLCPAASLVIGGWWQGDPATSLNGKLDEFRLYNRALNADEIAELSKNFREPF